MTESTKPHVFISHATRDAEVALRLQTKLLELSRNSLQVFVSEDPRSIPPGSDWLPRIREALDRTNYMIVLVSSAGERSPWVAFEAGYVAGRGKVVPLLMPGYPRERLRPPLAMKQYIAIEKPEDVAAISAAVGDYFDLSLPAFDVSDAYAIFGSSAFKPQDDPAIDVIALPRAKMYEEIISIIRRAKPGVHIRATSTIAHSFNDEEPIFLDYMQAVARKIGEDKENGYAADYTLVTAFQPEPNGALPPTRAAAVKTRLKLFDDANARDRCRLYQLPHHWSVDVLVIGDDYVVIGFPAVSPSEDPRLRHALLLSGHEFVTHIVHWFDHCVVPSSNLIDLATLTVVHKSETTGGA